MFDYRLFLCYNSSNTMRLEREMPENFAPFLSERNISTIANNVPRSESIAISQTGGFEKKERIANILAKITGKEKSTIKSDQQPKKTNLNNKFEPFEIPEGDQENNLFVNSYHGHHAKDLELNRRAVEKVLRLAHLDGQVFLSSLPLSRNRSLDANADGSVSAKKSIFWGEKLDEEKDNPYYRASNILQGWKIEINDQRMMDELMEKKIDPKKRQKIFINKFNSFTMSGLERCIRKEKLSSVKDRYLKNKLISSLIAPAIQMGIILRPSNFALAKYNHWEDVFWATFATFITYFLMNLSSSMIKKIIEHPYGQREEKSSQKLNLKKSSINRKLDHPWEWIMPEVEIDKVVGSFAYLNVFGQKLIREKQVHLKIT
jgi:hypothetical protein